MKPALLVPVLIVACVTLVGGTFALTAPDPVLETELRPTAEMRGVGALDGRTFIAKMGPRGEAANVEDQLLFADGLFLSTECEKRCNYPARPYFARVRDGATEFIAETRCPNKDATLVWRGTIDGNRIEGEFVWTSSRWYWTFERTFWFEGELTEQVASIESR